MAAALAVGAALLAAAIAGAWIARATYMGDKIAEASADHGPVTRAFAGEWPERPGLRVLLIGDSRVSDWRHRLPDDLAILERGLPGETAVQLARRFAADALEARADVVVVQAGVNDLVAAALMPADRRRAAERAMRAAFGAMEAQARAAGVCLVLTTIVPPAEPSLLRRVVWDAAVDGMVAAANDDIRRLAAERGVALLDLAALLAQDARLPDRYRRDTLHLVPAAYDRMNDALRERLQDLPRLSCGESETR